MVALLLPEGAELWGRCAALTFATTWLALSGLSMTLFHLGHTDHYEFAA